MNTSEYQAFLALLAPKNAGDLFAFNYSERSIERVGNLFALTQDFILTGTTFILVPNLIKMFEKVWCTFIQSQRIDGSWTMDPIAYLSDENDKIKLIYQPTIIALTCLLQGRVYFPNITYRVANAAIEQAISYISTNILDNPKLTTSNRWWRFCEWMMRVLDRPKKNEMKPLKQIFSQVEYVLSITDSEHLDAESILSMSEIELRLKGSIASETKKRMNDLINKNPLLRTLESRSICHDVINSQNINVEDVLWLPFWKLKSSCSQALLSAAIIKKLEELEDEHVKQLFKLILHHQITYFLSFDENDSSKDFQK